MKVVHVVRQFHPSVGGLETVVARLASEQRRRLGHDARVVTLDRLFSDRATRLAPHDRVDGVPVVRIPWRGSSRYPLAFGATSAIADADLVHVHAIDFFFDWLSATRAVHAKPLVASTHGGFFHTAFASTAKRVWFETVTRLSATGYRRIVATSDHDGAVFGRIAGRRVAVVENGADIDLYRDAAGKADEPVMLYFGRWSANKGLLRAIELFAAVRSIDPRWRLVVAGRPYDLDVDALRAHAARHGVVSAIEFVRSPSDDALRATIARSSTFVCLSRHEGFGLAAVEASSAGLFPVLSDIPPFRKIVEQSGRGMLVDEHVRAETAARRFVEMHRSRERDVESERAARTRAIDFTRRYGWSAVVDRYEAVYRDALAASGATATSATT